MSEVELEVSKGASASDASQDRNARSEPFCVCPLRGYTLNVSRLLQSSYISSLLAVLPY